MAASPAGDLLHKMLADEFALPSLWIIVSGCFSFEPGRPLYEDDDDGMNGCTQNPTESSNSPLNLEKFSGIWPRFGNVTYRRPGPVPRAHTDG